MNRFLALCAFVLMATSAYCVEIVSLNRDWRFFSSIEKSSDAAAVVTLPHTWNSDALMGKRDYFRGIGNYMRKIEVPSSWRGKRVYVRFQGAGTSASLFIDNYYVGEHKGGCTAFAFDITTYLKYGGDSFLWVSVNNSQTLDIMPTAGVATVYGGLYRDVELIVAEPTHFSFTDYGSEGIYINQKNISEEKAEIEADVNIRSFNNKPITIEAYVVEQLGDTVAVASQQVEVYDTKGKVTMPLEVLSPRLWNGIEDPFRYTMRFNLIEDSVLIDSMEFMVGLRSVSVDAQQGFMLNGKPYEVRGVAMQSDRAEVGVAVTNYQIREDLDLIRDMGANFIKVCGMPQSRYFYSECDRRGLLVWSDIPFIGPAYMTDRSFINTKTFKNNGKNMLQEIIYQNYNYASIVMWGIFSDMVVKGDSPIPFIKELDEIAREIDPTRLTACSSNQDGRINYITSVVSWSHSFGWKEGKPEDMGVWIEEFDKNWKNDFLSAVSYGAGGSIYHQADSLIQPEYKSNWHPENWQSHVHREIYPYTADSTNSIWGWFINYMFDYGAPSLGQGRGNGVDDMGLVSFDRKYLKDAYYFYKANWNKQDPFVHIANSRNDRRNKKLQKFIIYSNAQQVELFVNRELVGTETGTDGVFIFEDVLVPRRNNVIRARVDGAEDVNILTIMPEYVLD